MLYVRRVNDVITGGEKARNTVVMAFDFAVNKVGIDLDSYDLWKDYIDFYKTWTPGSNYELQQRNSSIRKVYKRCLVIPNAKLETMWADYRKWENEASSPNSASKFIADLSAAYMEVRPWNTEWLNATENLLRRKLVPYSISNDPSNIVANQVSLWFRWIELEKANKLNLPEPALRQRVEYVYRRAISMLPFVPELWYRLGHYILLNSEEGNRSLCVTLFADALLLNPTSFLIAFQLSEQYEKENNFEKARGVYDNIIKLLTEEHTREKAKIEELKTQAVETVHIPQTEATPGNDNDGSDDEEVPQPIYAYTEVQAAEIGRLQKELDDLTKSVTLLYIKLMSLCKRSQGIKEVRAVFRQRKNFPDMTYQFFVENALHEYYSDNKKTADKVFELAMKSFGKDGGFLYAYLEYLILSNSLADLNVIFEVAVTSLLKEIASDKEVLEIATHNLVLHSNSLRRLKRSQYYLRKMVKRYITFASSHLDLDTVLSLCRRFIQYFPETDDLALFSKRYSLGPFDVIAKYDLANEEALLSDTEELGDDEPGSKRRRVEVTSNDSESSLPKRPLKPSDVSSVAVLDRSQPLQLQQLHGFVSNDIYNLLQSLPNAGCFGPKSEHLFNSAKLVELFTHVDLPGEL